ncbi:MAG: 1-deoxy-D-xylulose-5-phosphate synthase [Candidatus Margulisiibacteriota bacterium]|jgi:1-deoxy-D-xylulose-5-phosphate synthase
MQEIDLNTLNLPQDIKNFSIAQLEKLAAEIRKVLIQIGDECGGHLASNLGVVELTIALHAVLDSPKDKIVWDVAHQSYVHKILTGRLSKIFTIRQFGGLSGFTKIKESDHDAFGAGHASTAISAGLGLAHARDLLGEKHTVVSVFGDGSLSGGMSFEALNNINKLKSNFICILNDNDMSISKPIGNMAKYITSLRTSSLYTNAKKKLERLFESIPRFGVPLRRKTEKIVERLRSLVLDFKFGVIFEEFGFLYLGPIDGHNITFLMAALRYAKYYPGPILLHVITKKGKGFLPAEEDPTKYHGINPQKSSPLKLRPSFTDVFGEEILALAKKDPKIIVVTPAMIEGSGLNQFSQELPNQLFDVGIAEEHAVTFAAGLARGGLTPIVAIYSTFLQRSYDQIIHDVCLQELPVIFAIDRAGLVGEDGPTHHGVFDVNFLLPIPNLMLLAPKDEPELKSMLNWATKSIKTQAIAIRYPRGIVPDTSELEIQEFVPYKAEVLAEFGCSDNTVDYLFIAYGPLVLTVYEAAKELFENHQKSSVVINLRFLKPFDIETLSLYLKKVKKVVVVEETVGVGSFYTYLWQSFENQKTLPEFLQIAFPDEFIEHGAKELLLDKYALSKEKIIEKLIKKI